MDEIIDHCLSLFFQYLYPLTPLVHEPSLREALAQLRRFSSGLVPWPSDASNDEGPDTTLEATFTLVTAICAEAAFLLPKALFAQGEAVAEAFLQASLHANGKPIFSWHIFGEAARLVQAMRLHNNTALEALTPTEAEMRRRVFWIVYVGDKSSALLNNRPVKPHRFNFEPRITTSYPSGDLVLSSGADLLGPEARRRLHDLYVTFMTYPDSLPDSLQAFSFAPMVADPTKPAQTDYAIIQSVNLQVTFHALRMRLVQTFDSLGFLGSDSSQEADLKVTEIARDMLRVLHEAPFWSLQVNGEPLVEKVRLVSASLLAIMHRNDGSHLTARAQRDFSILLNVLSRLDSNISDALKNGAEGRY
ncbi:hypothetical protein LZ31DRAFT_566778 [Colletotrichum somersetense]|nr:hypothetical protein LZ31DRAFT_566778 [Colletotrichum somersetense]